MRYLARSRASVSKPVYTGSWSFASFHDATPDISHLLLVSPRRYEALWFRDFPFFSLLSLSFFFYVGPTPLRIRQTTSFFPARKRSRERASKSREEAETFGSVWLGLFATDLDCFEEDQRGCSELAASRLISRFCFFVFSFPVIAEISFSVRWKREMEMDFLFVLFSFGISKNFTVDGIVRIVVCEYWTIRVFL